MATNLVLEHLRHIQASQDRMEQRLDDLTSRVGRIETNIAQIYVTPAEHSVRFDHLDTRITRIEKQLEEHAKLNCSVSFKPSAGDNSIEVFRVPLPKDQLSLLPTDDRNLLLLASHAVNQISVLQRVLIFSLNYESENELENTLSAAQSQTLLRFLFGALAEAWEVIKRPIYQKLIGTEYCANIEPEGASSYAALKEHFGKSNILHQLRNSISYHHPKGWELAAAFEDVPEDEDWAWYPSAGNRNSFYLASDLVISAGILRVTGETDTTKAFEKVMGLVIPVSNEMIDFFLYLMRAIVARHLDPDLLSPAVGSGTKILNVPELGKVVIPFFTVG